MNLMLTIHQIHLLVVEELRELIGRRRAALSLLLYIAMLFLLVSSMRNITDRIDMLSGSIDFRGEALRRIVEQLSSIMAPGAVHELLGYPSAFPILQILCVLWFPSLISMVSCDMISTDLHRGTLRLVLLRSSRFAYYFSKLLAHLLLYLILQACTFAALFFLSSITAETFSVAGYALPAVRYTLVFLPFLWLLVAGTVLISSFFRSPFQALIAIHLLWFVLLILVAWQPELSPFHWRSLVGLIAPVGNYHWQSAGQLSLWAATFTAVGFLIFARREV